MVDSGLDRPVESWSVNVFDLHKTNQGSGFSFGPSIPPEIMVLSPSSTDIPVGTASTWGIMRKKPEVGFGVVGTKR